MRVAIMSLRDFHRSPLADRVAREQRDRERDLGFGSIVGSRTRQRLLNRDGTFNIIRAGLGPLEALAPYHAMLAISWSTFFGVVAAVYLVLNVLFAILFVLSGPDALAGPGSHMLGGRFSQAFFFSVQTFATIGYGQIGPNGFVSNALVTIEALVGLMYQALATGLLFARFARPTASILFSRRAIIAPYAGGRSLQFRIANRRRNQIIELEAQVMFTHMQTDHAGRPVRRYHLLPLERNKVVFFPLSWTIVHPIDEHSPLVSRTLDDLQREEAEILVLLSGVDETFEQTVHARSSYRADEIVWDARFLPMFVEDDVRGITGVDLERLHDVEAVHLSPPL
jgi:inward rectifier potassium channel